jgi:serine/threonine protein kinase
VNTRQKPDPQADTLPSPDAAPALESADVAIPRAQAPPVRVLEVGGSRSGECLTDTEVFDYVDGRASEAVRGEVQLHIDGCKDCYQLVLAAIGRESVLGASSKLGAEPTTFTMGSVVKERYLIERFVGKGGMGEVYAAFDRLMQQRVALKTLLCTTSDDPRAVRKLFAEVRNAQRVGHAHVCRINELQEHQESGRHPVPFFTMEFVEGERLGTRLRRAPLPLSEVRIVALQLLEGLQAAHSKGVLHLDFKSDNVMLRNGSSGPDAVIMDFGLSRAQDGEARSRTSEQLQGAGTLPYMAIEQLECRSILGPPADVYAFGVVMYEMLTGRLPFDGDSLGAILLKQLRERPAPPSAVVPQLNPQLDSFVLKCLSVDPRQRYANAGQALAALSGVESWQVQVRVRHTRWLALAALAAFMASFAFIASLGERHEVLSNLPAPLPSVAEPTARAASEPTPPAVEIPTSVQPAPAPPPPSPSESPPPERAKSSEARAVAVAKDQGQHAPSVRKPPPVHLEPAPESPRRQPAEAPSNWPAPPRLVPIEPVPLPPGARSFPDTAR